jgi:predicted nucleotidyltransferase
MAPTASQDLEGAIRAVLAAREEIILAYLFGSAADGRLTPDSDVDVAVWAARTLDTETRMELIRDLGRTTGRAVDLVDLASTGVPLLQQVLTTGRELLCRDRAAKERLIIRMLNDVEDFLPLRRRALEERRERWLGTS